jgi:tetratricopeptide (TPR) repeat protein
MHAAGLVLFAAALSVRPDQASLRSGCEASDDVIARLEAGTLVEIRFAMTGGRETCYKVSAVREGMPIQGYLPASAIAGVEAFERERATAPAVTSSSSAPAPTPSPQINAPADHPVARAAALLSDRQPQAALEAAEKALRITGRTVDSLVVAGMAAYQSDELPRALEYLREAQELRPDRLVGQWVARIEKEMAGDRSAEKLYGTRFLLRYEGGSLDPEVARAMIATLEDEFTRISGELGCRADERIVTIVQSHAAYMASTGAAEWSGGQFDGKIRIPVLPSASISPDTRKAFAHELVHACLHHMGRFPAWLHEGMAQKLSGDTLTPSGRAALRSMVRSGRVPRLGNMSQNWSRMSSEHAAVAYSYALAAVELMLDRYRDFGLQNVLRNPEYVATVAADLDKQLLE